MPIHDWTRVNSGIFHHFHQRWISALCDYLNNGQLPPEYFALAEQVTGGPIPDVITLQVPATATPPPNGGVAVATVLPKTRFVLHSKAQTYARKANRVTVRHVSGRVVAVIELVSPGNKDSRHAVRSFVDKALRLLEDGIHLLMVDLFPPTPRDPQGLPKALWDEIQEDEFTLPADKPLTLASFCAGGELTAYIESVAVGDVLPDMPLFLEPGGHVPLALEATYQTTWRVFPAALKPALEEKSS